MSATTLKSVISQLCEHRETHKEWADWFENHLDDPRATGELGDAAFHRSVEATYTKMIEFLTEQAAILARLDDDKLARKVAGDCNHYGIEEIRRKAIEDFRKRVKGIEK